MTNEAKQEAMEDEEIKITSFKKTQEGLFSDDKQREQIEHNFGFSGQNIEEYSAVLENKVESLASIDVQQ